MLDILYYARITGTNRSIPHSGGRLAAKKRPGNRKTSRAHIFYHQFSAVSEVSPLRYSMALSSVTRAMASRASSVKKP